MKYRAPVRIAFVLIFSLFMLTTHGQQKSKTPLEKNLAGTRKKSWYLNKRTPERKGPTCQATSPQSRDNQWIFHANGAFEFDHGTITEDPDCADENCCGDLVNLKGTWSLANNNTRLVVVVTVKDEETRIEEQMTLLDASIIRIDDKSLSITATSDGELQTIEFTSR